MIHINHKKEVFSLAFLLVAALAFLMVFKEKTVTTSTKAGERELPIYCVDTAEKKIALTFDAAWGNEDTGKILEILERQDVKVTFFVTGGWVDKYPDDVKAIAAAGHEIGNHSQNHKHMSKLDATQIKSELGSVKEKADALTGQNMILFRPPYGDYNNSLITEATKNGYYTIQWSVDSLDWKDYGVENIINTVCNHKNLGPGAIILCHNGAKYTAEALEPMIVKLKEQGYTFVKVSELIYQGEFHMDAAGKQHAGEK